MSVLHHIAAREARPNFGPDALAGAADPKDFAEPPPGVDPEAARAFSPEGPIVDALFNGTVSPASEDELHPRHDADPVHILFWLSLAVAVLSSWAAVGWPGAAGPAGAILLIAMLSAGGVLALWVMRGAGRRIGLFPRRGAAERLVETTQKRNPFVWLESLEEPALLTDRGGAPIAANAAYRQLLAEAPGGEWSEEGIRPLDRLFPPSSGVAAQLFRLAKAARAGVSHIERLPPLLVDENDVARELDVRMAPAPGGRRLWRLLPASPVVGAEEGSPAAVLAEEAPVGVFSAGRDGRILYLNAALREFLGMSTARASALKDLKIDDILRADGLTLFAADARRQGPQRAQVRLRRRNGVETTVTLINQWGRGPSGDPVSRSVVYWGPPASSADAAPARAAPAAAIAHDPELFGEAPFGAARLKGETLIDAVIEAPNAALVAMFPDKTVKGATLAALFDLSKEDAGKRLSEEPGRKGPIEILIEPSNAPRRVFELFAARDAEGRPVSAFVIDATDRKAMEMRLAHGDRIQAVGQLAAGVAHEFNNIMTVIQLQADELLMRHPIGDPDFDALIKIKQYIERCAEHVKMILATARKQTFKTEKTDISAYLSRHRSLFDDMLSDKVRLRVVHGSNLPPVIVDQFQLQTVIINILSNARDAMKPQSGGELTIRTRAVNEAEAYADGQNYVDAGDYVLLEFEDSGPGIPEDVLPRIFDRYFSTKEENGNGIGLATVLGIVKQSGGYIYAVNRSGGGAIFKVYLRKPTQEELDALKPEVKADAGADRPQRVLSGRGTILVVEDEDDLRFSVAKTLRDRGYEILVAEDGEEGLALAKKHAGKIDVVVSDVSMPVMDGPEMVREAREFLSGARILFVSGYAEVDAAQAIERDHAVSFYPKPFGMKELAERVRQEIDALARPDAA